MVRSLGDLDDDSHEYVDDQFGESGGKQEHLGDEVYVKVNADLVKKNTSRFFWMVGSRSTVEQ
jgi:hypothetical protein